MTVVADMVIISIAFMVFNILFQLRRLNALNTVFHPISKQVEKFSTALFPVCLEM